MRLTRWKSDEFAFVLVTAAATYLDIVDERFIQVKH